MLVATRSVVGAKLPIVEDCCWLQVVVLAATGAGSPPSKNVLQPPVPAQLETIAHALVSLEAPPALAPPKPA